jgi:hypothetical protein
VGPVCEFVDKGNNTDVLGCDLTCMNHGICRRGAKDLSVLQQFGISDTAPSDQKGYNNDFEHCVCPRGYVGLKCEYQLDICPGGAHACLNGGSCITVAEKGTVRYACDCTHAETETNRFAGSSCEMESTQFCTNDGSKSYQGTNLNAFCTNGGKCRKLVSFLEP